MGDAENTVRNTDRGAEEDGGGGALLRGSDGWHCTVGSKHSPYGADEGIDQRRRV